MLEVQSPLGDAVDEKIRDARSKGHLFSIETDYEIIADGGIQRLPFLPNQNLRLEYDMIHSILQRHRIYLNKFNVVDKHLIIVTRAVESQLEHLDKTDLDAVCSVLEQMDGLVFYNCGLASGSSQLHKHMQFVPLPFLAARADLPSVPMEALLLASSSSDITYPDPSSDKSYFIVNALPFRHACSLLSKPIHVEEIVMLYNKHLAYLGLHDHHQDKCQEEGSHEKQRPSYNLLITRRWMFTVARSMEDYEFQSATTSSTSTTTSTIGVNSIGYAGTLLVKSAEELEVVRSRGPMAIITAVAVQKT